MSTIKSRTTIELSLGKNYVNHWTWKEAIREILQNALDCKDRDVFTAGEVVTIETYNGAISRTALLLGESGKESGGDTIGHFGEGLKLALLILSRDGYGVTVRSGKDIWTPEIKFSEQFQTECLHINIETDEEADENTVIIEIRGLNCQQRSEIDFMYIPEEFAEEKAIVDYQGNRVYEPTDLFDEDEEGVVPQVYVGGLYVCDLPEGFVYTYDLRPGRVSLDRDRKTVGEWDICWEIAKLLSDAGKAEMLVDLAKRGAKDVNGYTSHHHTYHGSAKKSENGDTITFSEELSKLAAANFKKVNGEKAIPVDMTMAIEKRRLLSNQIQRCGYHPILVSRAEFSMIGDAIKLPKDIKSVVEPDVLKSLQEIIDQHKMSPKAVSKIKELISDIQDWKDFIK